MPERSADFIPDLNKRYKVTLVHNYAEGRNDEIRDRFQALYDRIAERVTIERSRALAPGVMASLALREGEELIMGGGTNRKLSGNQELKEEVLARIRQLGSPAVGVCFGYQLLGRAYGAGIARLPEQRNGLFPVHLETSLGDMPGDATFDARLIHSWALTDLPSGLTVVASDVQGNPQAFLHDTLPVGGVQYHPEIAPETQPGAVESFGAIRESVLQKRDKPSEH
jgi:GMP synthase-like glutamine amidotransferase